MSSALSACLRKNFFALTITELHWTPQTISWSLLSKGCNFRHRTRLSLQGQHGPNAASGERLQLKRGRVFQRRPSNGVSSIRSKKWGASASGWHRPTSFSLVQNRGVPALGNRVGLTVEQHGKAEPT